MRIDFDGQIIEVPDDFSDADIQQVLRQHSGQPAGESSGGELASFLRPAKISDIANAPMPRMEARVNELAAIPATERTAEQVDELGQLEGALEQGSGTLYDTAAAAGEAFKAGMHRLGETGWTGMQLRNEPMVDLPGGMTLTFGGALLPKQFASNAAKESREIALEARDMAAAAEQRRDGIAQDDVQRFAGDVAGAVPSLIPAFATGPLGFGATVVTSGLQQGLSTLSEAQEAYKNRGMSEDAAFKESLAPAAADAVITAGITALSGKIFGAGAEGMTLPQRAAGVKSWVVNAIKQAFGESAEEGSQQFISDYMIAKSSYNPDMTLEQAFRGALNAAAVGGILGGSMAAGHQGVQKVYDKRFENALFNDPGSVPDAAVDAAAGLPPKLGFSDSDMDRLNNVRERDDLTRRVLIGDGPVEKRNLRSQFAGMTFEDAATLRAGLSQAEQSRRVERMADARREAARIKREEAEAEARAEAATAARERLALLNSFRQQPDATPASASVDAALIAQQTAARRAQAAAAEAARTAPPSPTSAVIGEKVSAFEQVQRERAARINAAEQERARVNQERMVQLEIDRKVGEARAQAAALAPEFERAREDSIRQRELETARRTEVLQADNPYLGRPMVELNSLEQRLAEDPAASRELALVRAAKRGQSIASIPNEQQVAEVNARKQIESSLADARQQQEDFMRQRGAAAPARQQPAKEGWNPDGTFTLVIDGAPVTVVRKEDTGQAMSGFGKARAAVVEKLSQAILFDVENERTPSKRTYRSLKADTKKPGVKFSGGKHVLRISRKNDVPREGVTTTKNFTRRSAGPDVDAAVEAVTKWVKASPAFRGFLPSKLELVSAGAIADPEDDGASEITPQEAAQNIANRIAELEAQIANIKREAAAAEQSGAFGSTAKAKNMRRKLGGLKVVPKSEDERAREKVEMVYYGVNAPANTKAVGLEVELQKMKNMLNLESSLREAAQQMKGFYSTDGKYLGDNTEQAKETIQILSAPQTETVEVQPITQEQAEAFAKFKAQSKPPNAATDSAYGMSAEQGGRFELGRVEKGRKGRKLSAEEEAEVRSSQNWTDQYKLRRQREMRGTRGVESLPAQPVEAPTQTKLEKPKTVRKLRGAPLGTQANPTAEQMAASLQGKTPPPSSTRYNRVVAGAAEVKTPSKEAGSFAPAVESANQTANPSPEYIQMKNLGWPDYALRQMSEAQVTVVMATGKTYSQAFIDGEVKLNKAAGSINEFQSASFGRLGYSGAPVENLSEFAAEYLLTAIENPNKLKAAKGKASAIPLRRATDEERTFYGTSAVPGLGKGFRKHNLGPGRDRLLRSVGEATGITRAKTEGERIENEQKRATQQREREAGASGVRTYSNLAEFAAMAETLSNLDSWVGSGAVAADLSKDPTADAAFADFKKLTGLEDLEAISFLKRLFSEPGVRYTLTEFGGNRYSSDVIRVKQEMFEKEERKKLFGLYLNEANELGKRAYKAGQITKKTAKKFKSFEAARKSIEGSIGRISQILSAGKINGESLTGKQRAELEGERARLVKWLEDGDEAVYALEERVWKLGEELKAQRKFGVDVGEKITTRERKTDSLEKEIANRKMTGVMAVWNEVANRRIDALIEFTGKRGAGTLDANLRGDLSFVGVMISKLGYDGANLALRSIKVIMNKAPSIAAGIEQSIEYLVKKFPAQMKQYGKEIGDAMRNEIKSMTDVPNTIDEDKKRYAEITAEMGVLVKNAKAAGKPLVMETPEWIALQNELDSIKNKYPEGGIGLVPGTEEKADDFFLGKGGRPFTGTLYRGVKDGGAQYTQDGRTFWAVNKKQAAQYGPNVSSETVVFQNMLDANDWMDAKRKLGLPKSATMPELFSEAERLGFDGIRWKANGEVEYIKLAAKEEKGADSNGKVQGQKEGQVAEAKPAQLPRVNSPFANAEQVAAATGVPGITGEQAQAIARKAGAQAAAIPSALAQQVAGVMSVKNPDVQQQAEQSALRRVAGFASVSTSPVPFESLSPDERKQVGIAISKQHIEMSRDASALRSRIKAAEESLTKLDPAKAEHKEKSAKLAGLKAAQKKIEAIMSDPSYREQVRKAAREVGIHRGYITESDGVVHIEDPLNRSGKKVDISLMPTAAHEDANLQALEKLIVNINEFIQRPDSDPIEVEGYKAVLERLAVGWRSAGLSPRAMAFKNLLAGSRLGLTRTTLGLAQQVGGRAGMLVQDAALQTDAVIRQLHALAAHKDHGFDALNVAAVASLKSHGLTSRPEDVDVWMSQILNPIAESMQSHMSVHLEAVKNTEFGHRIAKEDMEFMRLQHRFEQGIRSITDSKSHGFGSAVEIAREIGGEKFFSKPIPTGPMTMTGTVAEWSARLAHAWHKLLPLPEPVQGTATDEQFAVTLEQWKAENVAKFEARNKLLEEIIADPITFKKAVLGMVNNRDPRFSFSPDFLVEYRKIANRISNDGLEIENIDQLISEIAAMRGVALDSVFGKDDKGNPVTFRAHARTRILSELADILNKFSRNAVKQPNEQPLEAVKKAVLENFNGINAFTDERGNLLAPSSFYDYAKGTGLRLASMVKGVETVFNIRTLDALQQMSVAYQNLADNLTDELNALSSSGKAKTRAEARKIIQTRADEGEIRVTQQEATRIARIIESEISQLKRIIAAWDEDLSPDAARVMSEVSGPIHGMMLSSPKSFVSNFMSGFGWWTGLVIDSHTRSILDTLTNAFVKTPYWAAKTAWGGISRAILAIPGGREVAGLVKPLLEHFEEQAAENRKVAQRLLEMGINTPVHLKLHYQAAFDIFNSLVEAEQKAGRPFPVAIAKAFFQGGNQIYEHGRTGSRAPTLVNKMVSSPLNWVNMLFFKPVIGTAFPRWFDMWANMVSHYRAESAKQWFFSHAKQIGESRESQGLTLNPNDPSQSIKAEELGLSPYKLQWQRTYWAPMGSLEELMFDYYNRWKAAGDKTEAGFFSNNQSEEEQKSRGWQFIMGELGNVVTKRNAPALWQGSEARRTLGALKNWGANAVNQLLKNMPSPKTYTPKDLIDKEFLAQIVAAFISLLSLLFLSVGVKESGDSLKAAIVGVEPAQVRLENLANDYMNDGIKASDAARYGGLAASTMIPYVGNLTDRMFGGGSSRSPLDLTAIIPMAQFAKDVTDQTIKAAQSGDVVKGAIDMVNRYGGILAAPVNRMPVARDDLQARATLRSLRSANPSDIEMRGFSGAGTPNATPLTRYLRQAETASYAGDRAAASDAMKRAVEYKMQTKGLTQAEATAEVRQQLSSRNPEMRVYGRNLADTERQRVLARMTDSQRESYDRGLKAFEFQSSLLGSRSSAGSRMGRGRRKFGTKKRRSLRSSRFGLGASLR